MHERVIYDMVLRRRSSWALLATLLALTVFLNVVRTSTVNAQEPPPGDCWGGALSEDPLHCYVLEQAQLNGIIEIDALYETAGVLYIYLSRTEPVGKEVGVFFKEKAAEFVERWPDRVFYDHSIYHNCVVFDMTTYEDCLLNIETLWIDGDMLPLSRSYVTMELRVGGAEARRTKPGWASYRQVWPQVAGAASEAPVTSGKFDVSEVDMTNLPDVDCREGINSTHDHSCGKWHEFPDLGIAGFRSGNRTEGEYRMVYVQVKALPGEDVDAEAVIDTLIERYPRARGENYVIIPVKYDYGELWRWAAIINRFALSSGNTLGIHSAEIAPNTGGGVRGEVVFPLAELPEAGAEAWEEYRTTINIWTLHLQQTVDALPRLLGQLNVPVDAVGVVIGVDQSPRALPRTVVGGPEFPQFRASEVAGADLEPDGYSLWLPIGLGCSLVAMVLGLTAFVTLRESRG